MNQSIIVFLFTCLCISVVQGQEKKLNYLITYQLTYQPDSTDAGHKKVEETWLFTGNNTSIFLSKAQALKDSLAATATLAMLGSESWKEKTRATRTDFDFRIFKERDKNSILHGEKVFQDKILYREPEGIISWEIQSESEDISGYNTQRATTQFAGRNYTAWFTTEIPIPDGPYKFSGLPGLILKLEDSRQEYVFQFKGLKKLAEPLEINIPQADYREVSKEALHKLKSRFEEDPIKYVNNYVGSGGKQISIDLKGQQKKKFLKKRKAKMNKNPIELK